MCFVVPPRRLAAFAVVPAGLLLGLLLGPGCLGPNPRLEADTSTLGNGDSGDGDGDDSKADDGTTDAEVDAGPPTSCTNGERDGDESDVDCGGSCPGCASGGACEQSEDCQSGVCSEQLCAASSCSDGVQNGGELEVDCGGDCRFCLHSLFEPELDDLEGGNVFLPSIAMFDDRGIVLSYRTNEDENRLRWFDDELDDLGPSVELFEAVDVTPLLGFNWVPLATETERASSERQALAGGLAIDSGGTIAEPWLMRRGATPPAELWPAASGPGDVSAGDLLRVDQRLTVAWTQDDVPRLRRFDLASESWIDMAPLELETVPAGYVGEAPALASGGDHTLAVWVRCLAEVSDACDIGMRRIGDDWIDPSPVSLGLEDAPVYLPRAAITDDGRTALTWVSSADGYEVWAAILDANLGLEGAPWLLQGGLTMLAATGDVVALEGSFAFAWPDVIEDRVHLRRFVAPQQPLIPEIGDEAPWPTSTDPWFVRMARVDNHVVVVWSAENGGYTQIQGQVLSY